MSKARELASLGNAYSDGALSNRNLIINGAMQVWQRSVSVTGKTSGGYFTADRWQGWASGSTFNQSRQEVALGDSTVGAFKYFLRHEVTTANDFAGLIYNVEDVQSVPEGIVTLSFYAKGTNPNGGNLNVRVRQNFGTGGSPSSEVIEDAQSLLLTSSWQRFVYHFNVPSLSGKTVGTDANSSYYRIDIQQPAEDDTTDAWTLDITGVQLEVGDTATPFEHRSYGQELALCQRYYFYESESIYGGRYGSSSGFAGFASLPVTMRVQPTLSYQSVRTTTGLAAYSSPNSAQYLMGDISPFVQGLSADAEL